MIKMLIGLACVSAFLLMSLGVNGMDIRVKGSANEIREDLLRSLPLGSAKQDVISFVTSKLELSTSGITVHNYEKVTLLKGHAGEQVSVSSWVRVTIAEYRSVRRLFIKTTVVATFFFDQEDKLGEIKVMLYGDSL